MKATEALKLIRSEKNLTMSTIASRLGKLTGDKANDKKAVNVLTKRLSQENISVAVLNEMLRAMDYKVVIVPHNARLPADSYEIE